jgi:hypothetical protein
MLAPLKRLRHRSDGERADGSDACGLDHERERGPEATGGMRVPLAPKGPELGVGRLPIA